MARSRLGMLLVAVGLVVGGPLHGPARAQTEPVCEAIVDLKLRLRKLLDGPGLQRLLFRGVLVMDPALSPAFDTTGLRFQMIDAGGTTMVDAVLPPGPLGVTGAGWLVNSSATAWYWRDRAGEVSGIRRITLKRRSGSPDVHVVMFGQDHDFTTPAMPLTVSVLVPAADGSTAFCNSRRVIAEECFFRNRNNKLICH